MAKKSADELSRGRGKYTAVYQRSEGSWIVEVREIPSCHTYARSLSRARGRIRQALSLWVDDAGTATIVDRIELPASVQRRIATAQEAREAADRAHEKASAESRAVERELRDLGLSQRDSAELAGLHRGSSPKRLGASAPRIEPRSRERRGAT